MGNSSNNPIYLLVRTRGSIATGKGLWFPTEIWTIVFVHTSARSRPAKKAQGSVQVALPFGPVLLTVTGLENFKESGGA